MSKKLVSGRMSGKTYDEKQLKAMFNPAPLEALNRMLLNCDYYEENIDYDLIEKSLKALEIIKEKEVNVCNFKLFAQFEKWNIYMMHWRDDEISGSSLSQEEYDLLKEIL